MPRHKPCHGCQREAGRFQRLERPDAGGTVDKT